MAVLFAHTSLESGFSVNCTLLGLDGKPQQKGLAQILGEWAAFRVGTVSRRTGHQLERTTARIHILEGRRIAFLNIDRVIKVIREADKVA
jgi:topoisomerase-4 subunit A